MNEKTRVKTILKILKRVYPEVKCALIHSNAFELLAATILSAQCTDVQVNKVTQELFRLFPTPAKMSKAKIGKLEAIIHSTGFYHNKAKHLLIMSRQLLDQFEAVVPDNMEDLLTLRGVARKTANVVLGDWFRKPSGVVVDTHVKRISRLLHLSTHDDVSKIEKELMEILPKHEWIGFSHRLILLGRETCIARRPKCLSCPLARHCPSAKHGD